MKKILLLISVAFLVQNMQAQNVGIGTTNPQYTLDVAGASRVTGNQRIDGNLGIHIVSPLARLHVYENGSNNVIALFEGNGGTRMITLSNLVHNISLGLDSDYGFVGSTDPADFALRTDNLNRIMIKNNGYVGIGTIVPECKFSVMTDEANDQVAIFRNNAGSSTIRVSNGAQNLILNASPNLCIAGSQTGTDFALITEGADRLYIQNSTGNIGIGTSSPQSRLHVAGNILATDGNFTGTLSSYGENVNGNLNVVSNATVTGQVTSGSLLVNNATVNGNLVNNGNTSVTGSIACGPVTATTMTCTGATINGSLSVTSITQSALTPVTFQNGFSNYGGVFENVTYVKDKEGWVHLSGMVLIPASYSDGNMFTLPVGFRPEKQNALIALKQYGFARIDINNSGNVILEPGNSGFVSLSGISFRAI